MLSFGRSAPCPLRRRSFAGRARPRRASARRVSGEIPYRESISAARAPRRVGAAEVVVKVAIEGAGEGSMMDAVKLALVGVALLLAGGAAVAFGVLPVVDALAIADRVWPILLFVVAVTVVAELAARAGVFDLVAAHLARRARAAGERPGPPPMGGGGPPRHAAASRQRHPAVDAGARRRRRAHRRVRGALARNAARRTAALAARRLRVGPLPRRGRRSRRCSGTNGCARSASRCLGAATSSRASSRRP